MNTVGMGYLRNCMIQEEIGSKINESGLNADLSEHYDRNVKGNLVIKRELMKIHKKKWIDWK